MSEPLIAGNGKREAQLGPQNLYKARVRESLPWIVNPLKGLKGKEFKSFHVRHEASMIELFFDLFFVANLATFTAYHDITTSESVLAYIGFFLIMWSTWFQITIFDVRFAGDSVWERFCKIYQFIAFIIFAAVGASFNPGGEGSDKNYMIYQTMAVILGVTRWFLAIQYTIIACFVVPKYKKLWLPFLLLVVTFLISGAGMFAMYAFFKPKGVTRAHIGWWILIPLESVTVVLISSFWRMLSFKDTHMNERLSLLTMIIIGEGVIGASKTVGYLWPTGSSPTVGNLIAILSIVILLVLLWQTYFDNHPHGDYGTIKQQWWALSHFFLHLGFVGVVEGSNRMAVSYYAIYTINKVYTQIDELCSIARASNALFVSTMNTTADYLKLDYYDPRGYDHLQAVFQELLTAPKSQQPMCLNATDGLDVDVWAVMQGGIFKKFGIEEADESVDAYIRTFRTTFAYYWSSIALTLFMLLIFLHIVRRHMHDRFEIVRIIWRLLVAILSLGIVGIAWSGNPFITVISSPWVVPLVCFLMTTTLIVDRSVRWIGIWRFKRHYVIPAPDHGKRHGHGHSDSAGEHDEHLGENYRSSLLMHNRASIVSEGFDSRPQSYMSPPMPHTTKYQSLDGEEMITPGYTDGPITPGTPGYFNAAAFGNDRTDPIMSPGFVPTQAPRPVSYADSSYGGAGYGLPPQQQQPYYDPTSTR